METLDWTKLAGSVVPDNTKIPYEPNKHLFKKVAFDVFQMNTSPVESLWQLESAEDGTQYLVALYDEAESDGIEAKSEWKALADKEAKNVTLTYKNYPIQRFASEDYGFEQEDVHLFQRSLVEMLNSDQNAVSKMLRSQSKERIGIIAQHFPELQITAEPEDMPEYESATGEDMPQPYEYAGEEEDDGTKNFIDPYSGTNPLAHYELDAIDNTVMPVLEELMEDQMIDERFPEITAKARDAYSAVRALVEEILEAK